MKIKLTKSQNKGYDLYVLLIEQKKKEMEVIQSELVQYLTEILIEHDKDPELKWNWNDKDRDFTLIEDANNTTQTIS